MRRSTSTLKLLATGPVVAMLAVFACSSDRRLHCNTGETACGSACADTQVDPTNCGGCGTECAPLELCVQGVCTVTCGTGNIQCGMACVDPKVDPKNCGGCGQACAVNQVCAASKCVGQCPASQTLCVGEAGVSCVTPQVDRANCGGCGAPCDPGKVCSGGACGDTCGGAGETFCAGGGTPYCALTATDNANCGTCGHACPTNEACVGGTCEGPFCGPGETLCTAGDAGPTYCARTASDQNDCGSCGNVCASGTTCIGGVCSHACEPGLTLCGSDCVNVQTDRSFCGNCTTACGTDQLCTAGVCTTCSSVTAEICNGLDDDCNGLIDDGTASSSCGGCNTCSGGKCVLACGFCQTCISSSCVYTCCPYVFAYDGSKFAYETSVGGASVVGKKIHLLEGKEVDFEPMWTRLDRGQVDYSSGEGVVRTKVIAAEDEIVYFDHAGLTVVEAPPGYELISTSSIQYNTLGTKDPQQFYGVRTAGMRTPERASWMGRREVTAELSLLDEKAAAYDVQADNFYEIDFGTVSRSRPHVELVIDGWKYKLLRHLGLDVPQEKPRIEVKQADGSWKKAMTISTPRGDRKTVGFDLSRVEFPTGRYEMRIYTGTHEDGNSMWYLDRVRLSEEPRLAVTTRDIPIASATLDFTGVPSQKDEARNDHPRFAVDDGKGELLPEQRTWGRFTRYGDVRELLAASDNRMVVMRKGDGVELRFEGVPRASEGKVLTVFFQTDLLFKPRKWLADAAGTEITQNVEPLPFHGMGRYPYAPAKFPDDAAHQAYLREYQTREYRQGDPRWGGG